LREKKDKERGRGKRKKVRGEAKGEKWGRRRKKMNRREG
jgi:hypothetical protein